jgi:hypothetical protein
MPAFLTFLLNDEKVLKAKLGKLSTIGKRCSPKQ